MDLHNRVSGPLLKRLLDNIEEEDKGKLKTYIEHSMKDSIFGMESLHNTLLKNPICPKCERIMLRDKGATATCPICGARVSRHNATTMGDYIKKFL